MKQEFQLNRLLEKAQIIQSRNGPLQQRKRIINSLNETRKKRLIQVEQQLREQNIQVEVDMGDQIYVEGKSIEKGRKVSTRTSKKNITPTKQNVNKNEGVGDMDKIAFDKKFKNYLNHREQFLEKARKRREAIINKRKKQRDDNDIDDYFNEDEILSNTGSDYQYQDVDDMKDAYNTIATGKRRKKGVQLFHAQKFEFAFRFTQFDMLLSLMEDSSHGLISKDLFLNYLFDEPLIMMLYSINPYLLGDQISDYDTQVNGMLCFEEFSSFLLIDREPTYFEYSEQNIAEARKIGRGLKCAPIVGKWIDETGIYEFLIQIFEGVDMFGANQAERSVLAKKMKRQAQLKRLMDIEVVQIVNINKKLPLSRIIYEIEHELTSEEKWSRQNFEKFLQNYHRLVTPEKDKLITKLIMSGNYDSSYIYIVSQQVIDIVKSVFEGMQKFAQFFVVRDKFVQKLCNHAKYTKIKDFPVRSETNRYVLKETVEETLSRFLVEADDYVDIEQVLQFFTNRGRPKIIEYHVYIANLERQLAIIQEEELAKLKKMEQLGQDYLSTSSDEEFDKIVREKRIKRKKQKLLDIHNNMKFKPTKKFNVTVPVPFGFNEKYKTKKKTIREEKLKEMLEQKRQKQNEAMKPIPPKQVPKHVKQNLFQKIMKDQERQRLERLERFRLQIQNSMVPMSDRLVKKAPPSIHCDFSHEEYKFVARPMPWYCQVNLIDRINNKKLQRRQRILEQILNRHQDNDLPEGVLRMLQRHEKIQQKRKQNRTVSTGRTMGDCTFIPKISQGIPDFKAIHETLNIDLEIARENQVPVHPEPFSFQTRQKRSRTAHNCIPKEQRILGHSREYKHDNKDVDIKKTLKYEALVDYRRRKNEEDFEKKEEENRSSEVRKLRQLKFAPYVRKALRKNDVHMGKSRQVVEERLRDFRKNERKKKKDYQEEMIKIYTNVWNRPLLFENTGEFGESEMRKFNENEQAQEVNKERERRSKFQQERRFNEDYEEKRRRAIEQPPGQYLIEQDDDYDGGQNEDYEYEGGRYDEEDFEQQFLENGGLRTH